MFGILASAFNVVLGFVFRSLIIKFVVFFGLFYIVTEFISVIGGLLPNSTSLTGALGGIPSGVWYFLDLFNVTLGIPLLLSAWVTRFTVRRIPVIG